MTFRVGVVVPVHNGLPYIETLLTTITAQTWPCAAYVHDDASTDDTAGFLADRPNWYRSLTRSDVRQGWPAALNRAAITAVEDGCDALLLAAADDFLRLDCVELMVRALARHDWVVPHIQQVGGENVVQVSNPNARLSDFAVWPPVVDKAMLRTHVWQQVGGYSTDVSVSGSYGAAEDWEFWIKVWKAGYTDYTVVDQPVYYYRMHPGQLWRKRAAIHDQTVELIRAKHPDVWLLRQQEEAAAAAQALEAAHG